MIRLTDVPTDDDNFRIWALKFINYLIGFELFWYAVIFVVVFDYLIAGLSIGALLFLSYGVHRCVQTKKLLAGQILILLIHFLQITLESIVFFKPEAGFALYFLIIPPAAFMFFSNTKNPYHVVTIGLTTVSMALYVIASGGFINMSQKVYSAATYMTLRHSAAIVVFFALGCYLTVFAENSRMKQHVLNKLAHTDALTNILNRRAFFAYGIRNYEEAKVNHRQDALLIFDIDFFKIVNDTYGHISGDSVLIAITEAVSEMITSKDMFARYGGEEFAIYQKGIDGKESYEMAEALRELIEKLEIVSDTGDDIHITISVGVSLSKDCSVDFEELVSAADKALYVAKNSGRNQVVRAVDI